MKADAFEHEINVSQASMRGAYAVCRVLKEFQSALAVIHTGGGILERAAEFLVSQRGL
jgi:hypothetical protein